MTLKKPKMAAGGVSVRTFNFSSNFFQKHWVIVQSQKRCGTFSQKELQKKQDGVAGSPKTKSFSFR